MSNPQNPNLEMLMLAVDQLGDLSDEMVFLGGCATGLLVTDQAAPPFRPTDDVDAIVQIISVAEYFQFSKKLRDRNFREDTRDDAPVCRWLGENVTLDVMPDDEKILGFGSPWYRKAIEHQIRFELPNRKNIRLVSAPYFLITKLEAFKGRGNGDFMKSHDIEDIVTVLDGRPEILDEISESDIDLKKEISDRFGAMLEKQSFINSVSGHMLPDEPSQARVSGIIDTIRGIRDL